MNRSDSTHPLEALSSYLDGELSPSEAAAVELHLRECPECGVALEDLRLLSRAVADEEPPPLPAGLAGRIAGRLGPVRSGASSHRRGWFTGFFGAPMAAAAAAALAAGVLWIFWQGRQATVWSTPPEVAEQEASEKEESGEKSFAFDTERKAAMADAGQDKERSANQGPAPSITDRDARAADGQVRFATPPAARSMLDEDDGAGLAGRARRLEARETAPPAYAPSPPAEPRTTVPATDAATAAPTEYMKDEKAGRLGDLSSGESEAEAAVPEMIEEEQKVEVRDGLAYVTPGEGAVPPAGAGAAQSAPQMREKRARRAAPLAVNAVALNEAERDLVAREPGYAIRLTPSGEMTVSAGEYTCTVSPGEIAPPVAGESMVEDTSQAGRLDLRQTGEAPAVAPFPAEYYESALSEAVGGESDAQRKLLLKLVQGPYREALEKKCGPLPRPLAEDPEPEP